MFPNLRLNVLYASGQRGLLLRTPGASGCYTYFMSMILLLSLQQRTVRTRLPVSPYIKFMNLLLSAKQRTVRKRLPVSLHTKSMILLLSAKQRTVRTRLPVRPYNKYMSLLLSAKERTVRMLLSPSKRRLLLSKQTLLFHLQKHTASIVPYHNNHCEILVIYKNRSENLSIQYLDLERQTRIVIHYRIIVISSYFYNK